MGGQSFDLGKTLGFGGTGMAAVLGTLFYRPMDRINQATANLAQEETLLRSWSITTDLELMAADMSKRPTVRAAAERLRRGAARLNRSVEGLVEEDGSGQVGGAQPDSGRRTWASRPTSPRPPGPSGHPDRA